GRAWSGACDDDGRGFEIRKECTSALAAASRRTAGIANFAAELVGVFALRPAERIAVCPEGTFIRRSCSDGSSAQRCCYGSAVSRRACAGDWTAHAERGSDVREDSETVNVRRKILVDALLIHVAIP